MYASAFVSTEIYTLYLLPLEILISTAGVYYYYKYKGWLVARIANVASEVAGRMGRCGSFISQVEFRLAMSWLVLFSHF